MTIPTIDDAEPLRPEPPPSAEEWHERTKAMNRRTLMYAAALVVVLVFSVWALVYTAGAKAASVDSNNSTKVGLANNTRNGCITERRNAQADALGRLTIEANDAEASGLLDEDEAAAREHRRLYDAWVVKWLEATRALSPDVLDKPPPLGCGPVISSLEDIPADQ